MMYKRLGIIGCGLIGCSFAMAAKKAGIVERVVGYSKSPTTTESAKAAGILDETAPSAMQAVSGSDLVLIAVPVGAIPQIFSDIITLISPTTLVMDVGSTKQDVVGAAKLNFRKKIANFVPAHPIAGKDSAGFRAAEANLFVDRKVVLTPLDETNQMQLDNAIKIWQALGSKVHMMSPHEHDAAFAAVSHFPHLLAFTYMNTILSQPHQERFMSLAGTGFRDFTRIAAGEPNIWRDIFQANHAEIQLQINLFRDILTQVEQCMVKNDPAALQEFIRKASDARSQWTMREILPPVPDAQTPQQVKKDGFFSRLRDAFIPPHPPK